MASMMMEVLPPSPSPLPVVVATHRKTIGIIRPPPEIRNIIEKTAEFVAINGHEFEKRILTSTAKNNVRFNFLYPTHPYHAYYQQKLSETKASLKQTSKSSSSAAPTDEAKAPGTDDPPLVNFEIPKPVTKNLNINPPELEQYTVRLPEGITGTDLDIIKLTAQFVARNGLGFLQGLICRESQNQTFSFLKSSHSFYTFFTALADAYSKVLMPPNGIIEKLNKENLDRAVVLERCLHRLEWEKSQERERKNTEDEVEKEKVQMASIDWHDFVAVETIEFADDINEDEELPRPMTLEEVIRRSKALAAEEKEEEDQMAEEAAEGRDVVEMDMDEEEMQLVEEGIMKDASPDEPTLIHIPPSTDDDAAEPPMCIVNGWKRPEERLLAERDPAKLVVSPITGELIPIAEMEEHMRISLIDPKYKEQKERMIAKLRESTLATDDEISRNIVGLACARPDIFGTTEEEVSNAVKPEIEKKKKKKEEPKQVIRDGHTPSISRTTNQFMAQRINVDEQQASSHVASGLAGPMDPPKLVPPPLHPLPPPPGLALNIPHPPHAIGQPSGRVHPPSVILLPIPRLAILPTPSPLCPPLPPMVVTMPVMVPGTTPMSQYPNLPPQPRPLAYPQHLPSMPFIPPPPPPQEMPLPPLPEDAPPLQHEEPEPKRRKVDDMIPKDQLSSEVPVQGAVRIVVAVPFVESEGNLKGQTLEVTIHSLSETILSLKEKIYGEIGLPANKQKLRGKDGSFFKDNLSLAYYNVGPGEIMSLSLRERGGRKQ